MHELDRHRLCRGEVYWSELGERSFSSGHKSYRLKGIDRIDAQMVNIPALRKSKVTAAPDMVNKVGAVLILTCLARCLFSASAPGPHRRTLPANGAPRDRNLTASTTGRAARSRESSTSTSRRIPPEIASVKCKCPGSICSDGGDFRCHEVKQTVKVSLS
ncbi:hypothetical protein MRX96_043947 [Rhipicephalus microplus]